MLASVSQAERPQLSENACKLSVDLRLASESSSLGGFVGQKDELTASASATLIARIIIFLSQNLFINSIRLAWSLPADPCIIVKVMLGKCRGNGELLKLMYVGVATTCTELSLSTSSPSVEVSTNRPSSCLLSRITPTLGGTHSIVLLQSRTAYATYRSFSPWKPPAHRCG